MWQNFLERALLRETTIVSIIQVYIRPNRILKPSASADRFQHFLAIPSHFWMIITNMAPALVSEIDFMSYRIPHGSRHRMNPVSSPHTKDSMHR
jgi:hypothetical protein